MEQQRSVEVDPGLHSSKPLVLLSYIKLNSSVTTMEPQRLVPQEEDVKSIEVKLNEIPEFLRSGGYYRSFWEDIRDNEEFDVDAQAITVPETCFRATTSVSNANDLHYLLSTLRFWLVDVLPDSVIAYALNCNTAHSFSVVAEPLMTDLPKLKVLQSLRHQWDRSTRLIDAMNEPSCEEIVAYLFEHNKDASPLDAAVASAAAGLGSLKYLKYAHEQGCPWSITACSNAAANGHLQCLKYAHEHGCPWDASTNIKASGGGHLDCMKYAHEHGCPFDGPTIEGLYGACTASAAYHGHLNCLQYAHQHGAALFSNGPWSAHRDALVAAAQGGHIDCMQYAAINGCSWNRRTMVSAVMSGTLKCVKYLHELGCVWDAEVFTTTAAKAGNLDVVMFLHREGCPWTTEACTKAADAGHLDCLRYLHEHGCPWDEETTLAAAANGHAWCLEYAITRGCPVMHNICSRMFATNRHFFPSCQRAGCLKYLHAQGYKISGAATTAAKYTGDTPCVEYIASTRKRGRVHGRKST